MLPGFGPTLGVSLFYLGLIVLLPLAALFIKSAGMGWHQFVDAAFGPRVLAAYRLSFGGAFLAALVDIVVGLLVAWVLVRYDFPGRKLADAIVDLPFALPTSVAGIALTAIYAQNGTIGRLFAQFGIKIAYTPAGVVVAMMFIGLPFVVRTVQPLLQDAEQEQEEAASSLGADRIQVFWRVLLPALLPGIMTGFAMAFARGLGEYGSVVFIAGNFPGISEIAPLLIITRLEQFDTAGASAIAMVILVASFILLFCINSLQKWQQNRFQRS
jgi:sulfate transport system permease protein